MDEFPQYTPHRMPTARRPLLGLTVLVVEDSRFACDALRLLCLHSGARIRRADCLASAHRHLQIYRPNVVLIDLGLPDGSGATLIHELVHAVPRIDVVLGMSGNDYAEDTAMAAGADGFLAKPLTNLATFQEAILSRLPKDQQPSGPRTLPKDVVHPDPVAYRDDLCHAADTLETGRREDVIDYVAQFLTGVALSAKDHSLCHAAQAVTQARAKGTVLNADITRLSRLVQDRIAREPVL